MRGRGLCDGREVEVGREAEYEVYTGYAGAVPTKMMGTLTLGISKSVHTSISLIFLHKLCSLATPEHPEPVPLQNRV